MTDNVALKALFKNYKSIFAIDLASNSFEVVKTVPVVEKLIGDEQRADAIISLFVESLTAEDNKPACRKFNDLKTVADRLESRETISLVFQDFNARWCRASFIRLDDEDGKVLYTIEDADDEDFAATMSTQQAQANEEKRTRAVGDMLEVTRWQWTLGPDGSITKVWGNEALKQLFGNEINDDVEQSINDWISGILPAYRDEVVEGLNRLSQTQNPDDVFDKIYQIYDGKGEIHWIHTMGRKLFADNGIATEVVGTVQDITAEKKAEEQRRALNALAQYYKSVHIFDLVNDQIESVKLSPDEVELIDESAQQTANNFSDKLALHESSEDCRSFVDFTTMNERLRDKDSISLIFHDSGKGWCQANLIRMDKEDPIRKVLFTVEIIDAEFEQKKQEQEKAQRNHALVSGLSREYATVWFIDSQTRIARLVRNNMSDSDYMRRVVRADEEDFDRLMGGFVEEFVIEDAKKHVAEELTLDNLIRNVRSGHVFQVNMPILDENGNIHHMQACVARDDKDANNSKFILGFRDVNDAVSEQIQKNNQLASASAVIRVLSSEYHTVWVVDKETSEMNLVRSTSRESTVHAAIDMIRTHTRWNEPADEYVNNYVVPEDRERVLQDMSFESIMSHLRDHNSYEINFRQPLDHGEISNQQIVLLNADTDDGRRQFVAGFRSVDNILQEQVEKQKALSVIGALSEEYLTVYTVDLNTQVMEVYKLNDTIRDTYGKVVYCNEYADREAFFLEHSVLPEDREKVASAISWKKLKKLDGPTSVIYRNDQNLWTELKIVPTGDDMVVCGFAVCDEAVRKEKEREKELEEAKIAAEAANEAKSTFLFNMSHDIRTPLNAILGFTELQGLYPENIGKVEDYRQKVLTASKQLLSILNDVLEMARIESRKLTIETELTDSKEFVDSIVNMFSSDLIRHNLTMEVNDEIIHPYLYLDRTHTTEILMNVISNSIKYTPEGGQIFIEARELPGKDENECIVETKIRDTGLGMTEEFLEQIFDQFSRERTATDSGIHGTGLGMAIVKRLIEKMDGSIEIKSKVGEGTETTIRIPHRIGSTPGRSTRKEQSAGAPEIRLEGRRILLAEDLDVNAMLATEILQTRGLIVERAANGRECVEMLEQADPGYYDLILMDIQMPELNGYDATIAIRKLEDRDKAKTPVIAMTANAFDDDRRRAYLAGMNSHVPKPFQIDNLFASIQTTLKMKNFYIDSPALEEFKQKYEELECPCGYFVYLDDESEEIMYADSTTIDMFGCKTEEDFMRLVKGSFKHLVHPDDLVETEKEIIKQQMNSDRSLDLIEYRFIRKDEEVRKARDIGYKVFNGQEYVYYVYIVDVTELEE